MNLRFHLTSRLLRFPNVPATILDRQLPAAECIENRSFSNFTSSTFVPSITPTPLCLAIPASIASSLYLLMPNPPSGRSCSSCFPLAAVTSNLFMIGKFIWLKGTPSSSRKSQLSKLTYSPQTLWKGYFSFSNKTVW